MKTNRKCLIFNRVSTIIQDTERQLTTITEHCKKHDFEIVDTISVKISGLKSLKDRNDINQIYEYCKYSDIKYVIISELSRLGRTKEIIEVIQNLALLHVSLISIKENIETLDKDGKINSATAFLITVLGGVNTLEADTLKFRMSTGRHSKVKNYGAINSPVIPFGYEATYEGKTRKLAINEAEASIIRTIFEMASKNEGTNKIARWLTTTGIKTRKGNSSWSTQTVRNMLKNEQYKGIHKYKAGTDEEIIVNMPAIVDNYTFDKVNEVYKHTKKGKHTVNNYLLESKLIKCGICGKNYYPTINKKSGINKYCCVSKKYNAITKDDCGNNSVNIDKLNKIVLFTILYNKATKELIENELKKNGITPKINTIDDKLKILKNELTLLDGKENQLLDNVISGGFKKELIDKKLKHINDDREKISNELVILQNEQKALVRVKKEQKNLLELFSSADNTALLKSNINNIIEKIVIKPHPNYVTSKKNDVATQIHIHTLNSSFPIIYLVSRYSDKFINIKVGESIDEGTVLNLNDYNQYFKN